MEQALNTAKNILANLNDIQPSISVSGLKDESQKIKEMKDDIASLMCSLTPSKEVMERTILSRREDVLNHVSRFMAIFPDDRSPEGIGDDQIREAMLTAQSLSDRAWGYLDSKRRVEMIYGGHHAS